MTYSQFILILLGFVLGYGFYAFANACAEVYLFFERKNRQHREKRKTEKENKQ